MMDTIQKKNEKKHGFNEKSGSFCLEITLLFPLFMVILFAFIWQMSVIRCEMIFKSIIIKEAEKVSFVGVLSEYIPEIEFDTTSEIDNTMTDSILNELFTALLKKQIQEHYILMCEKNSTFHSLLLDHTEYIECKTTEETVYLTSHYKVYTPFMTLDRQFTIPLRLWNHGDNTGKLEENPDDNIWEYDNFTRGKILRRRFGGNLPFGFPVLSGFCNGNALIIKSMNLLLDTWSSPEDVRAQMQESIDEIASYQGMPNAWGEAKIVIREEEIQNRWIRFIIPENTPMDIFSAVFEEIRKYGENNGVMIEIILHQRA